jgi:hypothetical protein
VSAHTRSQCRCSSGQRAGHGKKAPVAGSEFFFETVAGLEFFFLDQS